MSRAVVNKSRAEKGKGGGTTAPAVTHEIVSGKFTDHDWYSMLDRDDGSEFAAELVDEVVQQSLSIIHGNYIQKQLLPFTLSQAKDAILQIIDWRFLSRDELETDVSSDISWQEDEEPIPVVTDCWAQGVVPRKVLPSSRLTTPQPIQTTIHEDKELEEIEAEKETNERTPEENETPTPRQEGTGSETDDETMTDFSDSIITEPENPPEQIKPEPPKGARPKRKFVPHKGRLKSAGLGSMTESLYETEMRLLAEEKKKEMEEKGENNLSSMPSSYQSILKSQAGRPPGNKDVVYDDCGNVISTVKLNPAKLPSHFVKTGYTVVDPEVEAAQARLHAMKTGTYLSDSTQKKKKLTASQFNKKGVPSQEAKTDVSPRNLVLPLPPPLIEMMDASAGVRIKEGERVKYGPKKWDKTGPRVAAEKLRIVRPPPDRPKFTAADILGTEKPMLKMMRDSPPIPPIKSISIA